jgi:ribosomal protein S27E
VAGARIGPVECLHCESTRNRSDNLIIHYKNKHPEKYHVKCGICGKWIFDPDHLMPHSNHARGYSVTCGICGKTFYSPDAYEDHMKRRHPRRA